MGAIVLKAIVLIATATCVSGCFQGMGALNALTALNLLTMSMPQPTSDYVATSDAQPVTYVTNNNNTYVSNTTYVTSSSSGSSRSSGHSSPRRHRH